MQRLRSQTPSSVSSTPNEVSAIPCELFGNTLRALFLKNRDFFCYGEIFLPNTRGPLGCLLGFWPSGPKPCGGNDCKSSLCLWDGKRQFHIQQAQMDWYFYEIQNLDKAIEVSGRFGHYSWLILNSIFHMIDQLTTTAANTPRICIFENEKQYFCTLCTCIFHL